MVLEAPRIRAKRTSTPPSPRPQKALQKSRDLLVKSGEFARAYFDRDVVDACRRADMIKAREQVPAMLTNWQRCALKAA